MATQRITTRDIRRVNRAALLRPIFLKGPLHRTDLGKITGLSGASVISVVSDLLDEGLIIEAGHEDSEGGRPHVLLEVNPAFGVVVGVDIGDIGIRVGVFDFSMQELEHKVFDIRPVMHSADDVIRDITKWISEMLDGVGSSHGRVLGVGIGVPGAVEYEDDSVVHAWVIGWNGIPLARMVQDAIGLPTIVENGSKTQGQAELWFGAARGASNAVVAVIAHGVGAAFFIDGALYRGGSSSAGEWGHTNVVMGGRQCRCGARGCLEAYVGGAALVEQWAEADDSIRVPASYDEEEWVERLVVASLSNPVAADLLARTATILGVATANLVNLFNPERVVLGGWVGLKLGPIVLPVIRATVEEQALAYPASQVSVEIAQLGREGIALGASTLVFDRLVANGGILEET